MIIGSRIKELRITNNLTQRELADKLGLTPKMISFYEKSDRTPPIDIVIRLAHIFNVSADYLLGLTSQPLNSGKKLCSSKKILEASNMQFGLMLSKARLEKKLNQRDLALELGVSSGAIGMWETGKRYPDLVMLTKIAQYFNVSTDYLLGLTSTPDSNIIVHGEQLTDEEKKLVDTYRSLNADERLAVLGNAMNYKLSSRGSLNKKKDIG